MTTISKLIAAIRRRVIALSVDDICRRADAYCDRAQARLAELRKPVSANEIECAIYESLDVPRAEKWIRANLIVTHKPRRTVNGLKSACDRWHHDHGRACYLPDAVFAECLERVGFRVERGQVWGDER
jgi:hypothetical protein